MNRRRPAWDVDRPWGETGEEYVKDTFSWPATAKIEVKRKRRIDEWIYVELEQNPFGEGWRPSGLKVTEAELWAWVIAQTGVVFVVPTPLLHAALRLPHRWVRNANETDGECPTRGKLIHIPSMFAWASVQYGPAGEDHFWCAACGGLHPLREHRECRARQDRTS